MLIIRRILLLFNNQLSDTNDKTKWTELTIGVLFIISLVLYLFPGTTESNKFYFIQYRAFEILLGGMAGIAVRGVVGNQLTKFHWVTTMALFMILFSSLVYFSPETIGTQVVPIGGGDEYLARQQLIQSKPTLLLFVVFLTVILICQNNSNNKLLNSSSLIWLGKRSFSLFVWHQILIAFYRIFVSNEVTIWVILGYFVLSVFLSGVSYRFVEKKIVVSKRSLIIWLTVMFFVTMYAGGVYLRAGVIKNVPELDIKTNNVYLGMHGSYCDRIYNFDREFVDDNDKIKILIEGVSFGRDFANCLLESNYADSVELSYVYMWDEKYIDRVKKADFIFTFTDKIDVPRYVFENMSSSAQIFGIGTKNYGQCNERIYLRRKSKNYFQSTIKIDNSYIELNKSWKKNWDKNYIDFIQMLEVKPGVVRVFTPDGKFISQDCEHFTKHGAAWFGKIINWETILRKK